MNYLISPEFGLFLFDYPVSHLLPEAGIYS